MSDHAALPVPVLRGIGALLGILALLATVHTQEPVWRCLVRVSAVSDSDAFDVYEVTDGSPDPAGRRGLACIRVVYDRTLLGRSPRPDPYGEDDDQGR